MKKLIIILSLLILIIVGFFAFNSYIYQEKQADPESFELQRVTLSGEYVCLPFIGQDQASVSLDDCTGGMKTESGEYYAFDHALMSQTVPVLSVGQKFSASGVFTPIERISTDYWQQYPVKGIFSITDSLKIDGVETETQVCASDVMTCPDGSTVGRSGSGCTFAACPALNATSTSVTSKMDETLTVLDLSITPHAILSDSRCPIDVTCVWAGTVEVLVVLDNKINKGEFKLKLGEPQIFNDYKVTLVEVTPNRKEGEMVSDSDLRFIFLITKI